MLISHNWLKKYIPELDENIEKNKLAELLTESLAEVEQIIPIKQDLELIVCAEIVETSKLTESKKLSICKVKTSEEGILRTVVCGAPNVRVGMKVALALPGGKVYDGHSQNKSVITIEQKELMNITSDGMLCSARELGISNEHDGILEIEPEMELGKDLTILLKDYVYEIENKSLSHRPDCFSHEGIAREIAAICNLSFIDTFQDISLISTNSLPFELKVKVDKEICPRFDAICISDIKIMASPLWLQSYLSAVGVRPINNVVDIANYVMFDKGQPIHTYDYDKLTGAKLIVKYAKNGENALFLNEKSYNLDDSMVIISNEKTTENVAGIIGGSNSEISTETKSIVIEAANFNMYSIRKTSKKLGLRTESSTRFEKGIDPSIALNGLKLVTQLVSDLAQGEVASELIDYYPEPKTEKIIELDLTQVKRFLGIELQTREILDYLKRLHFSVVDEEKISALTTIPDRNIIIKVVAPSYRSDINIPNDLLEEIARVYGYSNFKTSLPLKDMSATMPNKLMLLSRELGKTLSKLGFNELLTYSFVGEKSYSNLGLDIKKCLALKNPISPELSYLRNSLLPNLIDKCVQNIKDYDSIKVYEFGRIIKKEIDDNNLHVQPNKIAALSYTSNQSTIQYNEIKGVFEKIINDLVIDDINVTDYNEKEDEIYSHMIHKGRVGSITHKGKVIGIIGEISPEIMMNNLEIKGRIGFFEIDTTSLIDDAKYTKLFKKISIFQDSYRDLTLLVSNQTKYSEIIDSIGSLGIKEIKNIEYIGQFIDSNNTEKTRNLTIRVIMQSYEKTLSEVEINSIIESILSKLEAKFQIIIKK